MDTTISTQLANIETIRYVDDKVDNYETQVTRRISELMAAQEIKTVDGRQRLVGYDETDIGVQFAFSSQPQEKNCLANQKEMENISV